MKYFNKKTLLYLTLIILFILLFLYGLDINISDANNKIYNFNLQINSGYNQLEELIKKL